MQVPVFFGVTDAFGTKGGPGVFLKVLSTNKEDHVVAGTSYYPLATTNKFGIDVDVGYLAKNFAATVGWDFLQHGAQVGVGYVHTTHDKAAPAPTVLPNGCGAGTNNTQC